ncbi:MAG TPA: PAS domain S-box protein, partial [Firmicutes bacterium]|nr:PAS domain S-box protein [Bacillota bacterium]
MMAKSSGNVKNANIDSGEILARYLESAQDMVVACDLNGCITYANPAALTGFGTSYDELIGSDFLDRVEELSRSLASSILQMSINSEGWHGEILLFKAGKKEFPAFISASPIRDSSGNVERILIIANDITGRKRLEEEVRKRAEIANSIIRSAPIGIFTLDTDRTFKIVNMAFSSIIGVRKPAALIDRKFDI